MPSNSKSYDPTTAKYFDPSVSRRTAIVTGGHSGIGWYTVLHLYLHGYVVYLAGRTESKVLSAINDIKAEAKKREDVYTDVERSQRWLGTLEYIHIDMLDLQSVVNCAQEFSRKEDKLNVLINNAGIMGFPFELTRDGYEIQYQVNFVAPFLFTLKLLPVLEAAKVDAAPRVVMLSSKAHLFARRYYDPSDAISGFPDSWFTWIRYGNSKAAGIQFAKKLAELHPSILAFSVHPGIIIDTTLLEHWKGVPVLGPLWVKSQHWFGKYYSISCEEGSYATLRAALDPSLQHDNGAYLREGGIIEKPTAVASSQENIDKTWKYHVDLLVKKGLLVSQ